MQTNNSAKEDTYLLNKDLYFFPGYDKIKLTYI